MNIDTSSGYQCRHCRDGEVIAELNERIRRLNDQLAHIVRIVKANELLVDTLGELYLKFIADCECVLE